MSRKIKTETITGKLTNITRMESSRWGNPRYHAEIDGRWVQTEPDASIGYALPNFDGKQVTATVRQWYGNTTFVNIKLVS